ncbi:hypothetical protein F7725_007024 [Dissostichus mawsoni]|uniref:Family with sequence similarity 114 member A2 n=1 Tax=Dissostichus mawsoni TaxID=36200 RepID=A0A7J5XVN6_DISMA|nr:hypothetical protein F7725_007024 [Dissostichus mawsoni]
MSDSEAPAAPEVSTEDGSPAETPDKSSPTTPDNSTDVAPTRKARRRPEIQPVAEVEEKPKVEEQPAEAPTPSQSTVSQGGWGYWGSWGKTILSTATATVATVGQGLTQVIEKAETSLGIPSPTELSARVEEEQKEQAESSSKTDRVPGDGSAVVERENDDKWRSGCSGVRKKTMDVIAEGDPGFKKTKGLMNRNSTLSQVLREAKEREEQQTAETESSDSEKKMVAHYGMLFDEFQGLSHLEALEILSRESESKVKSVLTTLSGDERVQLREDLELIKESFSLVEFDDEEVDEKKACRSTCSQITDMTKPEQEEEGSEEGVKKHFLWSRMVDAEVHAAAIRSLAELTARSIELFHKLAEMILFSTAAQRPAPCHSEMPFCLGTLQDCRKLTVVLCKEISLLSKKFTSCLTTAGSNEKGDVLNPLITGVFLEASNSASYIQDAFQLLRPIVEISHIQRSAESTEQ